jgi:hypothetical protein
MSVHPKGWCVVGLISMILYFMADDLTSAAHHQAEMRQARLDGYAWGVEGAEAQQLHDTQEYGERR